MEDYIGLKEEDDDIKASSTKIDYSLLDNEIFFDAKKAKEKMFAARKKITENHLLPIYAEINKAINEGKTCVDNIWIKKASDVRDFLTQNGFTVTTQGSSNTETKIKIMWA